MARMRANVFISSPRIILWICAFFIMLSAGMATGERRCYWCGPLAEQVHRSRRAPPCDSPTEHVTTCEPGLGHCAVVATSPPHVESRFCIKLYQDECYPLFCNSSRTWKMTCPCRGDLCNGVNTERETEAFAVLSKLVAKTHNVRIKRAISTVSSKQEYTTIITNITTMEFNQNNNDKINEINNENEKMIVVTATVRDNLVTEGLITDNPTSPIIEQNFNSDHSINDVTTQENKEINLEEFAVTEKISHDVEELESNVRSTGINIIKEPLDDNTKVKPSEQLPTAEALQQNTSPTVTSSKTTELVRNSSSDGHTPEEFTENNTTAQPTKEGNNFTRRLSINIYMFLLVLLSIQYN